MTEKDLTTIGNVILQLRSRLEGYRPRDTDIEFTEYTTLKLSKEELYRRYSRVVVEYNTLCKELSEIHYINITIQRLLREISGSPRLIMNKDLHIKELRNLREESLSLVEMVRESREGMSAIVKFYHTFQYVMNSPRLDHI